MRIFVDVAQKNKLSIICIIYFICIIFNVGCSKYNINAKLEIGMTKEQVIEAIGDMPNKIINSSKGDTYVYYYYDSWIGYSESIATRLVMFNTINQVMAWSGWGFVNN